MIVAQTILVTPIIAALSRQIIEDLWLEYRDELTAMNVGPVARIMTLIWDGRFSLVVALLAGFGRAAAEVGAIIIVGGNIDGFTRTMTTTIALETSKGDLPLAMGLGAVLITIIILVNAFAWTLRRAGETARGLSMRAPPSELPIRFDEVTFDAGGITILDHVSLTLDAGAPTLVIGPNGSGKTTLLRMAMGLLSPSRGRVTWDGVADRPPLRRAIVFQRPVMLRRSVGENLRYALKTAGIPLRRRSGSHRRTAGTGRARGNGGATGAASFRRRAAAPRLGARARARSDGAVSR